jgi:hypothetical protein
MLKYFNSKSQYHDDIKGNVFTLKLHRIFPISHNVPAVYDVFAVAIKECVAFQQPQKCGGEKPHQGRSPTAVFRSPRALLRPKHIQSCYVQFALFYYF